MSKVYVKVCGMTRANEAKAACDLGVDAIGMILHANSPRVIDVAAAQAIRDVVPDSVKLVGVVVNASASHIDNLVEQIGLDYVQLHGDESNAVGAALSKPFIKAIRPKTAEESQRLSHCFADAKALLVDPYVNGLYGGTGHRLDVSVWPKSSPKPLILAGGLNAENVAQSIKVFSPWAVDLNSGLENAPGRKNLGLLATALENIKHLG